MSNYDPAPILPIGPKKFFCVEFPGHVKRPERAIKMMGGQKAIADAIVNTSVVELRYRDTNTFAHPIKGDIVPTSKLLVKVTRRVKKKKQQQEEEEEEEEGPYTIEMMGTVSKTLRFRALADFQYHVPSDDRIRQLKEALMKGSLNRIIDFRVDLDEKEAELKQIPPPAFTPLENIFKYNYRQNAPVLRVRVRQPDGSFQVKLINKAKHAYNHITGINYEEENVPTKSWHTLVPPADGGPKETWETVCKLYQERPIWSRFALKNALDVKYHRYLRDSLVQVAYTFHSGPWRDCWVKYGLDPRQDPSCHIYQQVDIRKMFNLQSTDRPYKHIKRIKPDLGTSITKPEPVEVPEVPFNQNHIFDGQRVPGATSLYQLCDIIDPDITPLIRHPEYRKANCSKFSGYYYQCVFERIRRYVRAKHFSLLDDGVAEAIEDSEKGIMEEIQKEIDRDRQLEEEEEMDLMAKEKAVTEAMEINQSAQPLKEIADRYIEELGQNKDFDDEEVEIDALEEYDEWDEDAEMQDTETQDVGTQDVEMKED
ncbi:Transcription factor tau subunit sfc1 [Choanephora cucurbitarum]|uniref:Transcription factor tau subunit sfc1 n=1 Tax=Choanephora cucurbitarum TaxID=101091 RepID=A0A1C7N6C3_9FUNG|nr:Transcription factor tau subunit sfc1 [Choanephora cucurbitarum]